MKKRLRAKIWIPPLVLLILIGVILHWITTSSQVVLLTSARGAAWIRADLPFNLGLGEPTTSATFSTEFTVPTRPSAATLRITALGKVIVIIDGQLIFDSGPKGVNWRREYWVPLQTAPGVHRLVLQVSNELGPSMVRVDCAELNIRTGESWTASANSRSPSPAILASRAWEPVVTLHFHTAVQCIRQFWPWLATLFVVGAGGYWSLTARLQNQNVNWSRRIKWAVLIAWIGLAANNIRRVPPWVGYDMISHLQYIQYMAANWRPPLPNSGWQFFQPPLYYFLSAIIFKPFQWFGGTNDQAIIFLRMIPLLCGIVMVEICHRAGRHVFPSDHGAQAVATVTGGLLPMNIYMAQAVGNEPLAGCLGAIVATLCLGLLSAGDFDSKHRRLVRMAILGIALSLTIMTKISGLIWIVPVLLSVIFVSISTHPWPKFCNRIARDCGIIVSIIGVICGWYFARNYLRIGVPFLTHAQQTDHPWWQYPGYRTPSSFFRLGRALVRPALGDLTSIWDGLYSTLWSDGLLNGVPGAGPPWNYVPMACGLWLAVPMMMAFGTGAVYAIARRSVQRSHLIFSLGTVAVFVIALWYVSLTLPVYCCVKSSYLLGTTPCIAVLIAAGFIRLTPNRIIRSFGVGLIFCWACTSYATYFVW